FHAAKTTCVLRNFEDDDLIHCPTIEEINRRKSAAHHVGAFEETRLYDVSAIDQQRRNETVLGHRLTATQTSRIVSCQRAATFQGEIVPRINCRARERQRRESRNRTPQWRCGRLRLYWGRRRSARNRPRSAEAVQRITGLGAGNRARSSQYAES